jgi:hypothetical protein
MRFPGLEKRINVTRAFQALVCAQRGPQGSRISTCQRKREILFQATLVRYRKLMPAFLAAGSQNFAAIGRFHALAEAVYGFPATTGGLVGPFHNLIIPCKMRAVPKSKAQKGFIRGVQK